MMIKGHLMVSTSAFIVIQHTVLGGIHLNSNVIHSYFFVLVGTLLPDIDSPKSFIGRRAKLISYPVYVVFGHRRLTHSALFFLSIFYLGHHYDYSFLVWISIGALFHILGDYLTHSGVPLLYPFGRNYRFIFTIPTNSFAEPIVASSLLISSILFAYYY